MEHTWFIEPLDGKTNNVIAQEVSAENAQHGVEVRCLDGGKKVTNLWRCTVDFVGKLKKSRDSLRLNFNTYNRRGIGGKIREVLFTQ